MKCPICGNTLRAPGYAFSNAEEYRKSVVVVTECCDNPIVIQPRISFTVKQYVGNKEADDWGTPIKKQCQNSIKTKPEAK